MLEIAKLTFREGLRRRTWIASVMAILAIVLLGLIPQIDDGPPRELINVSLKRFQMDLMTWMAVNFICFFASVMAVILAAGTLSGELDRGVLSVILPKPLHRWQLLTGKWLGIMLYVLLNMVVWCFVLWLVVLVTVGRQDAQIWRSLPGMMAYPVIYGTLAFMFSAFTQMAPALILTATVYMFAWAGDGIIRVIGNLFNLEWLKRITSISEWVLPVSRLGELLAKLLERNVMYQTSDLMNLGQVRKFDAFDVVFIIGYGLLLFMMSVFIFQRRDVQ